MAEKPKLRRELSPVGAERDLPQASTVLAPAVRPLAADRLLLGVTAGLVVALAIWFLSPVVRHGGWIAPIDDAYIHFQYAWNLARGHLFRYHAQDAFSTGETSPLYAVLLALFALVRVSRIHLVALAQLGGAGLLFGALVAAARTVRRETGAPAIALTTVAILVVHGFLLWCFFCGMETGLYLFGLVLLLALLSRWAPDSERPRGLVAVGALLPFARPDGFFATVLVAALLAIRSRPGRSWRVLGKQAALLVGPFLLYLVLARIVYGRFATAGLQMKAIPFLPYVDGHTAFDRIVDNAGKALRDLLGGGKPEFTLAWELPLALIGWIASAAQELRQRRPGVGCVGILLLVFSLVAGAQVGVPQWRGERYQAPTLLLFALGVALATGHLSAQMARLRLELALTAALALLLAPTAAKWQSAFASDAETIRGKQVSAAQAIRERLPADARVLVCDAGAIGFLSERWTYDVVGLTTPMRGNSYIAGPGSRFEQVERSARGRWPTHAAVYGWCMWEGTQTKLLSRHQDLVLEALSDPGLGTGDRPALHHPGVPADELDVADLDSEEAHHFREGDGGARERNIVGRASYPGEKKQIADGARQMGARTELTLRGQAGAHGRLVLRVLGPSSLVRLRVQVGEEGPKLWEIPPGGGHWLEPELDLGVVKASTISLRLDAAPEAKLALAHAWLFQESP